MNRHMNLLPMLMLLGVATLATTARVPQCYYPCGSNAFCDTSLEYSGCACLPNYFGNPYAGCTKTPQCISDEDCTDEEFCNERNICIHACDMSCMDVGCQAKNHKAECISSGKTPFEPPFGRR